MKVIKPDLALVFIELAMKLQFSQEVQELCIKLAPYTPNPSDAQQRELLVPLLPHAKRDFDAAKLKFILRHFPFTKKGLTNVIDYIETGHAPQWTSRFPEAKPILKAALKLF